MLSSVFAMSPGQPPMALNLGFAPRTVLVNNFTSNYVSIPDAGQLVPPFTYGAVIALPPGALNANASLVPALPAPIGPAVPRNEASLTWLDAEMTPAPGTLMPGTLAGVSQLLHATAPGFSTSSSGSFTVPPATESLSVITVPTGSNGAAAFTLTGATTNFLYYQGNQSVATASYEVVPVDPISDPVINWSWQSAPGNRNTDWFISPLPTAAPIDGILTPLPWQAPRTDRGIVDSTGANPATVVAAVAGQRIWVWSWKLEISAQAAVRFAGLRASSRVQFDGCFASFWSAATGQGAANGNAGGLRLPLGDSLLLDTTAANLETVRAAVGYTQA